MGEWVLMVVCTYASNSSSEYLPFLAVRDIEFKWAVFHSTIVKAYVASWAYKASAAGHGSNP